MNNKCDDEEYKRNIQHLNKTWHSKKWSYPVIFKLMEATAAVRGKWIIEDFPPVSEVLIFFPCYSDPKVISWSCLYKFKIIKCNVLDDQ